MALEDPLFRIVEVSCLSGRLLLSCSRLRCCLASSSLASRLPSRFLLLDPLSYDSDALTPTSRKLSCCTSSIHSLSSRSALLSYLGLILGMTCSPTLYRFLSSSISSMVLPLLGLAWRNMSNKVVTLASGLVSRTVARHDGQVKGCGFKVSAWEATEENHSFRHEPQKVCRQSSRVNGW